MLPVLRFLALMSTALSASAAFAHLLEMPAKLEYTGELWLHLLQTLYPTFGQVAGICEISAVVTTWLLVIAVRARPGSRPWSLAAAILLSSTHAIFWIWVAPVNAALVPLAADSLPADWQLLRERWEYGHAARALLQVLALGVLTVSLLVEIAPQAQRPERATVSSG